MKEKTLANKLMTRFVLCMMVLIVLSIPVLYIITTGFYAEDLADIINSYSIKNPDIDLERDTITGLFIQFSFFILILLLAVLLVMRYVPQRLWRPFKDTLVKVKKFNVEKENVPVFEKTNIKEFDELNNALKTLMENSVKSYRVQKEFTENASHELQTPIAIVQGQLDNMMQDKKLTEHQAEQIQLIYSEIRHMSSLNRNLLLLSKIENNQYSDFKEINLCDKIVSLLPTIGSFAADMNIQTEFQDDDIVLKCNEILLDSMLNNLFVNAVRHNTANGTIKIVVEKKRLVVSNHSDEPPLDAERVFSRFFRVKNNQKGNGLGLAIVKSICNYHHWHVSYSYADGIHSFTVEF